MWINRSYEAELLDGQDFTREELNRNLKELEWVNRFLGGHANSIRIMNRCLKSGFLPVRIIDIGCGGGDSLEILQEKFADRLIRAEWLGCDLQPFCLDYAKKQHPGQGLQYELSDFRQIRMKEGSATKFHASLFFHHFREEEINGFLTFVRKSGAAIIINDLHRHPLAYAGIKLIASLPGIGRLFRHDAALSVKRGFLRKDWESILKAAGYARYDLHWGWAFRHLLYLPPNTKNP
jgi:2-polyprenyl-3-methyl-5-hydroxy-6-metoxy-1,4-benzoquinol methylase